ncbi:MAG: hypothetical protein KatS3mg068_1032 [Candidatus Sericytochromatia bacterium]|nr:MAG: hypothetical protein KatS3mg068_1032 [Candidatus Sericytochromatia bacterium]
MQNYHFALKVDDIEFSVGGDKEFVESYMNKWLVLFKDKIPSELIGEKEEKKEEFKPISRGKMSLPDFIKLKSPKSYKDVVLTILFYYERYEGMENTGVPAKIVYDFFSKIPNNPGNEALDSFISELVSENFIEIMKGTEENPKYQVTFNGEQIVKQGFAE